jgi:hypothetical protein
MAGDCKGQVMKVNGQQSRMPAHFRVFVMKAMGSNPVGSPPHLTSVRRIAWSEKVRAV